MYNEFSYHGHIHHIKNYNKNCVNPVSNAHTQRVVREAFLCIIQLPSMFPK